MQKNNINSIVMNKILFSLAVIISLGITACNNNGNNNNNTKEPLQAKADTLYNELIKEHNEGMSGWMKIEDMKKKISDIIDSITALPLKDMSYVEAYKTRLAGATEELTNAYNKMDAWMSTMNLDSSLDNLELRIKYLSEEKQRASEITALVNNSLQKADSLLKVEF